MKFHLSGQVKCLLLFKLTMAILREKMRFLKKIVLIVGATGRHQTLYDTHPSMVINRTKFHVCTPSSFGRVKVYLCMYKAKICFLM